MTTCSMASRNCNPCFVRLLDITYNNTHTCFAAPPKQNMFNTSSSWTFASATQEERNTSKRTYIHPNLPLSTALRIFFQNPNLSDSGQDDKSTFQYPRSQSITSRDCDLQRKMDTGNTFWRSGGMRLISSLFTLGIGYEISGFSWNKLIIRWDGHHPVRSSTVSPLA